jgi:hypothetical protein
MLVGYAALNLNAAASAQPRNIVFEVPCNLPRIDGVVIDAESDDWGDRGWRIEALSRWPVDGPPASPAVHVRAGWDADGLLVFGVVHDQTPFVSSDDLFAGDRVELFWGRTRAERDHVQLVFAPPVVETEPSVSPRMSGFDHRGGDCNDDRTVVADVRTRRTAEGYVFEARMPWHVLDRREGLGAKTCTWQLFVCDAAPDRRTPTMYRLFPAHGTHRDGRRMIELALATEADQPLQLAASYAYEPGGVHLRVNGATALRGQRVRVEEAEAVLGELVLDQHGEARATLPLANLSLDRAPVYLCSENGDRLRIDLADPTADLRDRLDSLEIAAVPNMFTGETFPALSWRVLSPEQRAFVPLDTPEAIWACLGPFSASTRFYDRRFQSVTRAETSGMYAAVTELRTTSEPPTQFISYLYRDREELPPWCLPAGAEETKAAAFYHPRERRELWEMALKERLHLVGQTEFLAVLPPGYDDAKRRWPLLLDVHPFTPRMGYALRRDLLLRHPLRQRLLATGAPLILASVVVPYGEHCGLAVIERALREAQQRYRIDSARVYLASASYGAAGAWRALQFPGQRFAAAILSVPVGLTPLSAESNVRTPVRVFLGGNDPSSEPARALFQRLQAQGFPCVIDEFPQGTHTAADAEGFAQPDLIAWLLKHALARPGQDE